MYAVAAKFKGGPSSSSSSSSPSSSSSCPYSYSNCTHGYLWYPRNNPIGTRLISVDPEALGIGLKGLGVQGLGVQGFTYLWLVGNGGMEYNSNYYYYYHSSIPY